MCVTQLSHRLSIFNIKLTSILPCMCHVLGADPDSPLWGKESRKQQRSKRGRFQRGPHSSFSQIKLQLHLGKLDILCGQCPPPAAGRPSRAAGPSLCSGSTGTDQQRTTQGPEPGCKATGYKVHEELALAGTGSGVPSAVRAQGGLVGAGQRGSPRKQETRHRVRAAE